MVHRKILLLSALFLVRSLSAQPIISGVVQVSPDNLFNAENVSVTIDQADPTQIAAGANLGYYFYSSNRGQSWFGDGLASSFGEDGDPSLVSDSKGDIYHTHLSSPLSSYWLDRIVVQKSTDSGRSFSDGAFTGYHPPKQQVKPWITCDLSPLSPYHDDLYLTWTEYDVFPNQNVPGPFDSTRILFSKSTDAGKSWSMPLQVSDGQGNCSDTSNSVEGARCVTALNGEIYITWSGPNGLMFDKSTDGGNSFGTDKILTPLIPGWNFKLSNQQNTNGFATPLCDISSSKHRGSLYIFFSDKRSGINNSDIFMFRSLDGGNSWDPPVRVNNDTTQFEQYMPAAAIDQVTGAIYCVFYDRRNSNGGSLTDTYIARSVDGGLSFSNYRLTPNPFIYSAYYDEYLGIAAHNSYVYPIWMEYSKNGPALYSARIVDTGAFLSSTVIHEETNISLALQISPNPAHEKITLHLSHHPGDFTSIIITDLIGRKLSQVYEGRLPDSERWFSFDAHEIPNGMYYLILQSGEKRLTQKIIISH